MSGFGSFVNRILTKFSRSNDYSRNASSCKSSLKAILLNKVVVGRGCKMVHDSTSLTAPPSGYDSVCACVCPHNLASANVKDRSSLRREEVSTMTSLSFIRTML